MVQPARGETIFHADAHKNAFRLVVIIGIILLDRLGIEL